MSGISHSAGQSDTTRTPDEGTESENGPVKKQKMSEDNALERLQSAIHGNVYQLKLLILFLIRGLNLGYDFTLATEIVVAEKFDDIVFGYTDKNGKDVCRFLQAKHKQDETKKITLRGLLTEKDDEFGIKKYFISYCKIKRNPVFKGYDLRDFTICTNINIDIDLANNLERITHPDDILHFKNYEGFERYKIDRNRFPKKDELESNLLKSSELVGLANMLAVYMADEFQDKKLELTALFKNYHCVLVENVIQCIGQYTISGNDKIDSATYVKSKFRDDFIDGDYKQLPELKSLRKIFYEEYQRVSKKQIDENVFRKKMEDEIFIHPDFKSKSNTNPQLTNHAALAEKIVNAIKVADKKIAMILWEPEEQSRNIRANIDNLRRYVFVKKLADVRFHFKPEFLDENEKLPNHLEKFRTTFIAKLKNENIEFSEMKEYEFHISILPDDYTDVVEFFERLVLSVNQPNEVELDDYIQEEIRKSQFESDDKYFKLIPSDLMASKLLKHMLDWMKDKKAGFITNEKGKTLFKEIRQRVFELLLIDLTSVYRAQVEQFGIFFCDNLNALEDFLKSDEKILNLISSCDTIFSSIKVLQTLKNSEKYQADDSYIFMRLDSLLHTRDCVMEVLKPGTFDLLVIECKATTDNVDWYSKLSAPLSALLNSNEGGKVVLITLKDGEFAAKFNRDFSAKNHCREIHDRKHNLTDLTVESQNEILAKGKVKFLGEDVSLNAVVDAESTHLLSEEVLSMLIKNEELKIGKPLIDQTYIEVEKYFIDRTLIRHTIMVRSDFKEEKKFFVPGENPDRPVDVEKEIIARNQLSKVTDIILISDTCDEFEKVCKKYKKQHSIHWLKKEEAKDRYLKKEEEAKDRYLKKEEEAKDRYLKKEEEAKDRYVYKWQQSCGNLTNLSGFIYTSERSVDILNKIAGVSNEVVLVAAEPGMGKSVLLSHLSLETQSVLYPLWIVRSNLIDHSKEFSQWMKINPARPLKISVLQAVKFLYIMSGNQQNLVIDPGIDKRTEDEIYLTQNEQNIEIIVGSNIIKNMTGSSLLEMNLFAHFFNKGKALLLFDGFDEICPHYKALVEELLKALIDTKKVKSLWLTTRCNIQCETENQLSTFAYTLQPFLKENQRNFLKKFWKKNMKIAEFDEAKANVFIEELLHGFSKSTNDLDEKFTSIPLQIYMIADVFFDMFKEFYFSKGQELSQENKDTLTNQLDLVSLYEKFLKTKFEIEQKKKYSEDDREKAGAKDDEKILCLEFEESHEILAMCTIFKDKFTGVLSKKKSGKIEESKKCISEAKRKTGVICRIVGDEPEFIHRTFAEYLAAKYVWKKFSDSKVEKFEENIVRGIVIKILIKDDAIQVSKFLQSIARKNFNSSIGCSTWESKIKILLNELTNQIDDYDAKKEDNFQSTKLLLGIIEFFLQKQEEENHSRIIENQSPKLLCVCAEMGYTKLAEALTGLNTELLKQHLSERKWPHCPLWLAAENAHLDIIRFLVVRFSYNAEWQDAGGQILIQRIFHECAFKVLKSCLELNIIDCGTFKDHEDVVRLPLLIALDKRAPTEVIKLLIEKTNASTVNEFHYFNGKYNLPVNYNILFPLLYYDKPKEVIELAMRKGIDFSCYLNTILEHFRLKCFASSLRSVEPSKNSSRGSDHSFNNFCNLFPIIEQILKAGVGYSFMDARLNHDSIFHIVKQINDKHKLLYEIHNIHKQNDKENDDPRHMLFKLIFNYIRSRGFESVKITVNPNEVCIFPHYKDRQKCETEFHKHTLNLIFIVIRRFIYTHSPGCALLKPMNNVPNMIHITSVRKRTAFFNNLREWYPQFKSVMMELFFEYYILLVDGNSNLVKSALDELKKCPILAGSSALPFPVEHSSLLKYIHKMYNESEILENIDEENNDHKESLIKLVKALFFDVLILHFKQCYEITEALDEISENVSGLEEVFNKLLEMKNKSSSEYNMILNADQILDILGLKNIVCERKDLQKLVSEMSVDITCFNDLVDVWLYLSEVGKRNVIPVLEHMFKFSAQFEQIFDLFKELHECYNNLIRAVEINNITEINSTLQNVKQDFVKATIHGQDEHYGSPLHYAALNGQADIINIFLDHGANPNLRLCSNDFKKITHHFSPAVEKLEKDPFPSDEFINWTPLYFAVLNNHKQAVQNLIERGADVNYVPNPGRGGYSLLHISALSCGSLEIARLLLKNGARYNVPNKKGKTPLNLATSGSDVEKLLRSIDELFLIVEEGETNANNSVFKVQLDFDSWEAVLKAKNTDNMTLLELTKNNAQKDIFELLSEKLRIVEPRVLQRSIH